MTALKPARKLLFRFSYYCTAVPVPVVDARAETGAWTRKVFTLFRRPYLTGRATIGRVV